MNNGTNAGANGSNQNNDAIVKLNIGGFKYITTKATLCSHGENFFTALLKGSIPSLQDEGYYFIDRNGRYFEPILDYLRTTELHIPSDVPDHLLLREAKFYGIVLPLDRDPLYKMQMATDTWLIELIQQAKLDPIRNVTSELEDTIRQQFVKAAKDGRPVQFSIFGDVEHINGWVDHPQTNVKCVDKENLKRENGKFKRYGVVNNDFYDVITLKAQLVIDRLKLHGLSAAFEPKRVAEPGYPDNSFPIGYEVYWKRPARADSEESGH